MRIDADVSHWDPVEKQNTRLHADVNISELNNTLLSRFETLNSRPEENATLVSFNV